MVGVVLCKTQPMSPLHLPDLKPRQIVAATLIVIAIILAFWLLFRFHQVLILFLAALVISTAIQPVIRGLHKFGVSRSVSVVAVYLLFLALFVGFIWLLTPLAISQTTSLAATLPDLYAEGRQAMLENRSFFIWRLGLMLPEQLQVVGLAPFDNGDVESAVQQGMNATSLLMKGLFALIAVLALTFYWTLDGQRTTHSLLLLLPSNYRESLRNFIAQAEARIGAFVVGQLLLSTSISVMALIAYLLLDLPFALGLALVAGVMELIPYIGPVLGALPAILVAYSIDPVKAIWVIVATIIIQQLENSLLVPRIMRRSVGVHPLVTLLAIISFGLLFGVVGALVAIPLAAILQLIFDRTFSNKQEAPAGRDQISLLQYEVQELIMDIRKQIRHKEADTKIDHDQVEDLLETIAVDLDHVLVKSHKKWGASDFAFRQEDS
jgi:predicted PurR-regulated permease PerM